MKQIRECHDGTKLTNSHWKVLDEEKPILCVDFDHTITTKCLACEDGLENNDVQQGCIEALQDLKKYFRLVIFTGNPAYLPRNSWKNSKETIEKWLRDHSVPFDAVLQTKPPAMFIVDDRAIHHTSWERTLNQISERMCK